MTKKEKKDPDRFARAELPRDHYPSIKPVVLGISIPAGLMILIILVLHFFRP